MAGDFRDGVFRWCVRVLFAAVAIGGGLLVWPKYQRGLRLAEQDAELARQISAKRAEIAQLASWQRRFREDPDFVEHIARLNRRLFPGELIFIFEDGK